MINFLSIWKSSLLKEFILRYLSLELKEFLYINAVKYFKEKGCVVEIILAKCFLITFVLFIMVMIFDYSKKVFYNIDSSDIFSKNAERQSDESIASSRKKAVHSKINDSKSHRERKDRYEGRYADYKEYRKYKKI